MRAFLFFVLLVVLLGFPLSCKRTKGGDPSIIHEAEQPEALFLQFKNKALQKEFEEFVNCFATWPEPYDSQFVISIYFRKEKKDTIVSLWGNPGRPLWVNAPFEYLAFKKGRFITIDSMDSIHLKDIFNYSEDCLIQWESVPLVDYDQIGCYWAVDQYPSIIRFKMVSPDSLSLIERRHSQYEKNYRDYDFFELRKMNYAQKWE